MTDIFDLDSTEETPETETTETQPESEAVSEKTPEQIAQEWLKEQGIEELDIKKVRNLAAWEKDVNAKASDLGNIAKALESKQPAQSAEPTLDDETKTQLITALGEIGLDVATVTRAVALAQQTVDEGREEVFVGFIESHDDVPASELVAELIESGIDPEAVTPAVLRKELNKAYKVLKADKLDPEAIKKQAIADYLADLAAKGVKPEDVTEVKKGRGAAAGAHRSVDDVLADDSVSLFDKIAALQQ